MVPGLQTLHVSSISMCRWQLHPLRAQLRQKAKEAGLWNLWISAAMAEELRPLVSRFLLPGQANLRPTLVSEI